MSPIRAQVITPNSLAYLTLVQNFVEQLATMAGLSSAETTRLSLAVEEAFSNMLRYGFEPGVREDVTLRFETTADAVRITLGYRGLPFDPAMIPDRLPDLGKDPDMKGLGMGIMRAMCDEVHLRNLGHGNLETVLIKRFNGANQTKKLVISEPAPAPISGSYTIRPMHPDEAVQVSGLAFIAYGDTYPHHHVYFPEQIKALNAQGKLCSWVAVTPAGEVVSHVALRRATSAAVAAEVGIGLTKPAHRGRGCLHKLTKSLLEAAPGIGLEMVFVTAVTTHDYSQKTAHLNGFRDCALLVAEAPAFHFRAIADADADADAHRETFLLMLIAIRKPQYSVIYAPPAHAKMVRRICRWLGLELAVDVAARVEPKVCNSADMTAPDATRSLMQTVLDQEFDVATIRVQEYGADFLDVLRAQLRDLLIRGTKAVRLSLSLEDPAIIALVPEAETLGFFFCGLTPTACGGIHLLMQHLGGMVYDYSKLRVRSDEGKVLLDYVKASDPMQSRFNAPRIQR